MKIHVYDTYVKTQNQQIMHFDVFITEKNDAQAIQYAREWLDSIGETESEVTSKECRFCHSQEAPAEIAATIDQQGYFIFQMEGCPDPSHE